MKPERYCDTIATEPEHWSNRSIFALQNLFDNFTNHCVLVLFWSGLSAFAIQFWISN